ncbi:hypothetical protein D3C79_422840 [compost metagenome]
MIAIGIRDQQGHRAPRRGIRGTGQGWSRVIGIVRGRYCDHRRHQVDQLIFLTRERIANHTRVGLGSGIKTRRRYGGIAGTIYGDEATIAAGACNAADVACSGCPARRRRFKCLGRIRPRQNSLLQGGNIVRHIRRPLLRQLGFLRLGSVARAQGKGGLSPLEAGPLRRKQDRILGQHIAFGKKRLAPVSGNQIDFALQLGNDDILIQYDVLAAHGFS